MNIPFSENCSEYDVIVCGGGPAGCCAAIAAARLGVKVLLTEATSALGGMGTMGMVSAFAPFTDGEKLIYRSVPVEILERYKKRMGIPEYKWDWIKLSPEDLKRVYDDMVTESGAEVLFQSSVCSAETENRRIKRIYVAGKGGLKVYRAKVFIDCTGDGDLAAFSGVPFEIGQDGEVQSSSLCFAIGNVHTDKINIKINSNFDDGIWPKIISDGKYPLITRHFIPVMFGDTLIVNGGHLYIENPTDSEEISKAYILGRKTAEQYITALKEYLPEAFGDSYLVETAPLIGVRESRRINGKYTVTVDDYVNRRNFDDEIARNSYWLDCHSAANNKNSTEIKIDNTYKKGDSHGIPFRCLIPENIRNLLVAGRCISVERTVLSSTRVMPNCLATGEAAGIGAALAVKTNTDACDINGAQVRKITEKK